MHASNGVPHAATKCEQWAPICRQHPIRGDPLIPVRRCGSVRAMPAPENKANDSSQIADFEKSLDELEQLVAKMEHGEQSLDESLKSYERGIALFRNCQTALEQAELRVKLLSDPQAPDDADDFDPETP
jgi:exodeoxyribonuclease VII small subunit